MGEAEMSRKDSKDTFAAALTDFPSVPMNKLQREKSSSPHLLKVAAGVRELNERNDLVNRMLRDGEKIAELDVTSILPSTIADRLDGAYDTETLTAITESIRERGQLVPGLVRPVKGNTGHFQIVFGRRRLAAAQALGIKFKAIVRELSDDEAVVMQGEENTVREDLSFIEKCAFALGLEQAGYSRQTICAALSTTKSHVSEMIKVASAIPRDLLLSIGKAPGVGRGRWTDFAHRVSVAVAIDSLFALTRSDRFLQLNSDARFNRLNSALSSYQTSPKISTAENVDKPWTSNDRSVRAISQTHGKDFIISLTNDEGVAFGTWISKNLDSLFDNFKLSSSKQQ